ncbi:MAG: hypothetical protein QM800_00975 [Paludibacter sp.]
MPNELKQAEQLMETRPDSALHVLQKINLASYKSPSHKALYGLLYFETLDKLDKSLEPDWLIDFSINYYHARNERLNLAKSYFYKARMYKKRQRYNVATEFYLKLQDLLVREDNYFLLGSVYSDLGDICMFQKDYDEALKMLFLSADCFKKAGNKLEAIYRIATIGKIYRFRKDIKRAQKIFEKILLLNSDSLLHGFLFQEIGINYFWLKKYDSAQFYLRKSLFYPARAANYAVQCFYFADSWFNVAQYDSAFFYAQMSLKYPSNFFCQRDCYRILANSEYQKKNFKEMNFYISKYQESVDSVRKVESQPKVTMLEDLHNKDQETAATKRSMIWVASVLVMVLLFSGAIAYWLFRRSVLKKKQLEVYKKELNQKQEFVSQSLSKKIADRRESQAEARKNASPEERERLDKDLYEKCLHLGNWEAFSCEMNHAFNQIVECFANRLYWYYAERNYLVLSALARCSECRPDFAP